MKQFKKDHYEKVFDVKNISEMEKVENFLKKNGIKYKVTSKNGITPIISIYFRDDGSAEKPY